MHFLFMHFRLCISDYAFPIMLFIEGSLNILFIEGITALRAELRRMGGIFRFPAALVTFILRSPRRLRRTALCAELTLIGSAAGGAGPSVRRYRFRLVGAAVGAELALCGGAAGGTGPGVCGSRLLHSGAVNRRRGLLLLLHLLCLLCLKLLLLHTHGIQILCVHSTGLLSHIHAHD